MILECKGNGASKRSRSLEGGLVGGLLALLGPELAVLSLGLLRVEGGAVGGELLVAEEHVTPGEGALVDDVLLLNHGLGDALAMVSLGGGEEGGEGLGGGHLGEDLLGELAGEGGGGGLLGHDCEFTRGEAIQK